VSVGARGRIVIAAALAQKPRHGGHAWVPLQYALGFRRLGWDVMIVDRLERADCVDAAGAACGVDSSANLRYFSDLMKTFGFEDSFAVLTDGGARIIGRSRADVVEWSRTSAFLFNIMGFLTDPEITGAASRRVFLDIDPGFGQMWRELGLADIFHGHDTFVTVGTNIGAVDCAIPTCGLHWITTVPPVCTEYWPVVDTAGARRFTSVASWRGRFAPIEYGGRLYGLRVHEFRRFAAIPRWTRQAFELALDIDPSETRDLSLLAGHGWRLVDPRAVAGDPFSYRDYVGASAAEFSIAKGLYVDTRSGWISDRSVSYLASGKPVVAQDTGADWGCAPGQGVLTFTTPEEALEAVEKVAAEYSTHSRAARALVEGHFESDRVLGRLLQSLRV
jgi:hypothetical protein